MNFVGLVAEPLSRIISLLLPILPVDLLNSLYRSRSASIHFTVTVVHSLYEYKPFQHI